MPEPTKPAEPAPPSAAAAAPAPAAAPAEDPKNRVLNEEGTHVLTKSPAGVEWFCPLDHLERIKEAGYTVVSPSTTPTGATPGTNA